MKDIFSSYHKQKVLSHLGIFAIAWVLAVSVNMFVLSEANTTSLKANIKEVQTQEKISEDLNITTKDEAIVISANQIMNQVQQISLSFAYNYDLLTLWDSVSWLDDVNVSKIETTPWFSTFIITFTAPLNIDQWNQILKIWYTKSLDQTVHLNPININFLDTQNNNYSLTSSSLIF